MRGTLSLGLALAVVFATARPSVSAAAEPRPEKYLINGRLVDAEKELSGRLAKSPKDDTVLQAALAHLRQMLAMSREMWKFVLAETDDENEWIPNPKQKSVIGITVTQQMVDGWLGFLDEADAPLAGKRLIPFWRNSEKGVNLRRVFTQPRTFDLVLWFQGTAAVPYLEDGPKTRPEVWDRLWRAFEGDLFLFAAWFN